MAKNNVSVVIPAGGIGSRFDKNIPKQFFEIGGKSILENTIEKFSVIDNVNEIIIAIPTSSTIFSKNIVERKKLDSILAKNSYGKTIKTVLGGKTRTESVKNALKKISDENEIILI
ncbi:MAG: 2-C-methyl-D-erythritol 4-phosphate cytidylyltransferase, partial [Clostridiales Family XIII bacterium]|nr:2-C-methyl-D-erythritol 4-phosphate cytidylyltransferase [Clostridiales Family XIII bacterium]